MLLFRELIPRWNSQRNQLLTSEDIQKKFVCVCVRENVSLTVINCFALPDVARTGHRQDTSDRGGRDEQVLVDESVHRLVVHVVPIGDDDGA